MNQLQRDFCFGLALLVVAFFVGPLMGGSDALAEAPTPYVWRVTKTRWSPADERGYERFVMAIAAADCHTVSSCLSGRANPLALDDPPGLVFSADCADLVYMLRAYYAWKHGLPFGLVSAVEARDPRDAGDLRFSKSGNRPKARFDIVAGQSEGPDIRAVLDTIRNAVSTATFRIDPRIKNGVAADFYSPRISRRTLRPGTAIYNGDGHVVLLTSIDAAGRIHFMDAHPDFTVTRGIFSGQFVPGDPAIAAGFHAWRPVAVQDGALKSPANANIPDVSMEQYFGPGDNLDWTRADFTESGRNIDFLEFTRRRLAKGRLVYDIRKESKIGFDSLCDEVQDRARAVDEAITAGMATRERPATLQGSNYEEGALWFAYSTPGRDKRLRLDVVRFAARLQRMIALYRQHSRAVHYRGRSMRASLRAAFAAETKRCAITYRGSRGEAVTLTLGAILERLPDLSFDPYHCIERRWGATGEALMACPDPKLKTRWYEAEASLRTAPPPSLPGNPTLQALVRISGPSGQVVTAETLQSVIDAAPAEHRRRRRPRRL